MYDMIRSLITMSKAALISKGKAKYTAKINALGGASAYLSCGAKGGMDTAICMKGLKAKLTATDWADAWEIGMK